MQRNWMVGLVLAFGGVGATAQEVESTHGVDGGPRFTVEYGASATQVGFALVIEGGVPFSQALVSLATESGLELRGWVALDEHGGAKVIERNAERGRRFSARCMFAPEASALDGSVVTRTAVVDLLNAPQAPLALAAPGDIVICEIMKDPSFVTDAAGEWFEIRNRTSTVIDLNGWRISDATGNGHTINAAGGVLVQPKSYFVLGLNIDPTQNGGVTVGYRYPSTLSLSNGADEIRLADATGALVDVVTYDDGIFWPDTAGKSITLNRAMIDSTLNDDGANWCSAISTMSGGNTDSGTPRLANNVCP